MRRLTPLLALMVSLCVVGCQGDREVQQALLDLKNEHTLTLMGLTDQSEFLEKKLDHVREKLEVLDESDRMLSSEFALYARRPDEIKREILDDVGLRTVMIAEEQQQYFVDLTNRLDQHALRFDNQMVQATEATQKTLSEEDAFFRFVFTEQDSINRVFAARFENRPWYESVLAKWEDRAPVSN
jgi:hypothetical protein